MTVIYISPLFFQCRCANNGCKYCKMCVPPIQLCFSPTVSPWSWAANDLLPDTRSKSLDLYMIILALMPWCLPFPFFLTWLREEASDNTGHLETRMWTVKPGRLDLNKNKVCNAGIGWGYFDARYLWPCVFFKHRKLLSCQFDSLFVFLLCRSWKCVLTRETLN